MPPRLPTPDLVAAYTAAGAWQTRTLLRTVQDAAVPDRPAVADQHARLSYGQLLDRALALAGWLVGHGARPGDVVAVQTPSRVLIPTAHLACVAADLVLLPMSDHFGPTEVEHLAGTARARFLVLPEGAGAARAARLRAVVPSLELVGAPAEEDGLDFALSAVLAGDASFRPGPVSPDRPHLAMVSSGTTALPKVSLWTDNNLWFFLERYRERIGLLPSDLAVQIAPANTGSTGYVFPVLAPLLSGASSVLLERWSPAAALDLLASTGATLATAVPTQLVKMVALQESAPRDLSALRAVNNAGAALAPEHARRVETVLGAAVQTSYGASDGGVPTLTDVTDDDEHRRGSVGRVLPHTECRLVDAELRDVPAGQPGEVVWRNPTKSYGYLNDPAQDEVMFTGEGWYRSGDLGLFDADGYLRIVGRTRDMIIRGGQNINPGEIEDALLHHPLVADAAVVGIPDPVYGERAAACVVARPGPAPALADLTDFLLARGLATYKLPELLELFDDLPKTNQDKVSKTELRSALATRGAVLR